MDSRKLGYFVAVVDHGGFTAAAKAVFVSQPALSLAIKDLEAEVGAQLFTRIGHRIRLTAAGSALVEPARQVVRDLETGRAAVAAVTGLLSGSLSLASLPTLAADPMAGMVGEFRLHHGGVRVELAALEDSDELFALVESGTSELGLTDAADTPRAHATVRLGMQELVFILPPDSATGGDPIQAFGTRGDTARGGTSGNIDPPVARSAARGTRPPTPARRGFGTARGDSSPCGGRCRRRSRPSGHGTHRRDPWGSRRAADPARHTGPGPGAQTRDPVSGCVPIRGTVGGRSLHRWSGSVR